VLSAALAHSLKSRVGREVDLYQPIALLAFELREVLTGEVGRELRRRKVERRRAVRLVSSKELRTPMH
jgi:hypothetical protein